MIRAGQGTLLWTCAAAPACRACAARAMRRPRRPGRPQSRGRAPARLNAALGGVDERVRVFEGDLWSALPADRSCGLRGRNPPLMPVADDVSYPLFGHGGPDGLRIVQRIVGASQARLRPARALRADRRLHGSPGTLRHRDAGARARSPSDSASRCICCAGDRSTTGSRADRPHRRDLLPGPDLCECGLAVAAAYASAPRKGVRLQLLVGDASAMADGDSRGCAVDRLLRDRNRPRLLVPEPGTLSAMSGGSTWPRALIVNAPFGLIEFPHLGTSLIKAATRAAGFDCDVLVRQHRVRPRIGFTEYLTIERVGVSDASPGAPLRAHPVSPRCRRWMDFYRDLVSPSASNCGRFIHGGRRSRSRATPCGASRSAPPRSSRAWWNASALGALRRRRVQHQLRPASGLSGDGEAHLGGWHPARHRLRRSELRRGDGASQMVSRFRSSTTPSPATAT